MVATYKHQSTGRTVTSGELGRQMPFKATLTAIVDAVTVRMSIAGTTTGKATVYITDNANNPISQKITVTVAQTDSDVAITGLNAAIVAGRHYSLVIVADPIPNSMMPGVHHSSTPSTYTQTLNITEYQLAAAPWVITTAQGMGFPIGGTAGYAATGSAYRSLDVGSVPAVAGTIQIVAYDSPLYPLVIDMYSTNDPALFAVGGVTGWTAQLGVQSGDAIPAARYFRFHIQMSSNANQDIAPALDAINLYFDGAETIFTTRAQRIDYVDGSQGVSGVPVVHDMGSISSQLTNKAASVFAGKIQVHINNEPRSLALLNDAPPPIGRPVHINFGYDVLVDRVNIFNGTIDDVRYTPDKLTLMISDSITLADISIPRKDSYPAWDAAADYAIGALVTHKFFTYKALSANGATTANSAAPDASPTVWQQLTFPKVYDTFTNGGVAWHLVDIIIDILRNDINIPDSRINFASLQRLKALRVGYTGTRTLIKPEKALTLLGELAWLLEAQWVQLSGGISLVPEHKVGDPIPSHAPHINDNDIGVGSFSYRRGWKELVNECVIMTQWDGTNFNSVTAYADATSVSTLRKVQQEVGHDKWMMPPAILDQIAAHVVARKNQARRIISIATNGKHLRLECGDIVTFESSLLPASDPVILNMKVIRKDISSWQKQSIRLTLMEVL